MSKFTLKNLSSLDFFHESLEVQLLSTVKSKFQSANQTMELLLCLSDNRFSIIALESQKSQNKFK